MQAILFALFAYIGWGTGDVFGTIAARKLGGFSATIWSCILRVIIFGLYAPFAWKDLLHGTPFVLTINILLGCLLLFGFFAFNKALEIGNPSLVGGIVNTFPALVVILSIIFFHEFPTIMQLTAIATIFFGMLLLIVHKPSKNNKKLTQIIALSLFTFFCFGLYFTFIKIPVKQIGWYWPNVISFATFPILFAIMHREKKPIMFVIKNHAFLPLIISIFLTGMAEFSFNYAIGRGLTAVVAPIAGSSPTLFFIVSYLVFREPLTKRQILGIIVTLVGIVALSFLSS